MRYHSRSLLAVLTFGFSFFITMRADPVDDVIAAQMAKHQIPGLSLAVIDGGKIVKVQGYGLADVEAHVPVTPATLFQAGSVSKPVAAVGALALVDAGKLTLDDDINTFLKSWHVPENEFTRGQKVTLRRLLSHTAGITVHGFPGYAIDEPIPTLQQVLDGEKPANTAPIRVDVIPGSINRYSGGGYVIVQHAIIDLTGQSFPAYELEHVLKPLGMNASTYEQPLPKERWAETAAGYALNRKPIPGRWHVYPEMAPAGLWTTASDLARFAIAIQQTLAGKSTPVLSTSRTREALTAVKAHSGLGFFLSGAGASRRFGHDGRDEGFDTSLQAYCELGKGAVVMINTNDSSSAVRFIMEAIADAYHWPDYPHPKPAAAIEDKEPEVTAQVKQIFEGARAGRFDRDLYTNKLGALMAKQLAPGGPVLSFFESMGALKSVELLRYNVQDKVRQYRYRFTYEHNTLIVDCVFDADGKVSTLRFKPE